MQARFGRRTGPDAVMQYSVVWLGATLTDPVVGSSPRFVISTFVHFGLVLHVSSALAPRCRSRGVASNESSTCSMDAIVGGGAATESEGSVDLWPQPTNGRQARTITTAHCFICHPGSAALALHRVLSSPAVGHAVCGPEPCSFFWEPLLGFDPVRKGKHGWPRFGRCPWNQPERESELHKTRCLAHRLRKTPLPRGGETGVIQGRENCLGNAIHTVRLHRCWWCQALSSSTAHRGNRYSIVKLAAWPLSGVYDFVACCHRLLHYTAAQGHSVVRARVSAEDTGPLGQAAWLDERVTVAPAVRTGYENLLSAIEARSRVVATLDHRRGCQKAQLTLTASRDPITAICCKPPCPCRDGELVER